MFEGFEPANTTPVPDILFDELLTELSGSELKVLLYIIRRTWGFKKDTDAISLNQFTEGIITKDGKQLDKGCGIKNRSAVTKALTSLEVKGRIVSTKGKDPLGDYATSLYSIRFRVVQNGDYRSAKQGLPVVQNKDYRSLSDAPPVVQNAHLQEIVLQQTDKQETVLQESTIAATLDASASLPPSQEKIVDTSQSIGETSKETNGTYPSNHSSDAVNHAAPNASITLSAGVSHQQNQERQINGQPVTLLSLPDSNISPGSPPQQSSYSQREEPKTIRDKQSKKVTQANQETLLETPLSDPTMEGAWDTEKVVQYAEWCNQKRYRETARKKQINAAQAMHKDDPDLTLAQFKQAYDERNDDWWHEHKGLLHVEHMREKDRVHEMLDRIEAKEKRAQFLVVKPSERPQPNGIVGVSGLPMVKLGGPPMKVLPPVRKARVL